MIYVGIGVLFAFAVLCRMAHDAPIGEEVEGIGFVRDPRQFRELRRQDHASEGYPHMLRGVSDGGQVNNFHGDGSRSFQERNHG